VGKTNFQTLKTSSTRRFEGEDLPEIKKRIGFEWREVLKEILKEETEELQIFTTLGSPTFGTSRCEKDQIEAHGRSTA